MQNLYVIKKPVTLSDSEPANLIYNAQRGHTTTLHTQQKDVKKQSNGERQK